MQHIWATLDKLHVCKRSAIEIDVGKISRITSFTHFHYLLEKITIFQHLHPGLLLKKLSMTSHFLAEY